MTAIRTSRLVAVLMAFALALLAHAGILVITTSGGLISLARLGWRRTEPAA